MIEKRLKLEGKDAETFLALFEDDDKVIKDIAWCLFIKGLSYEATAIRVGYSERNVFRKYQSILKTAIKRLLKIANDVAE